MKKQEIRSNIFFGEDTPVKMLFDDLWMIFSKQDERTIREAFMGIDSGRSSMLRLFKTEEEFISLDKGIKILFLNAMDKTLRKAIKDEHVYVANGISFFNLWVMAIIQENFETKEHIESEFSKLRSKYDL